MKAKFTKNVDQIISFRMGDDLTQPYNKFSCFFEGDNQVCNQERVTNYGSENGIKARTLFVNKNKTINFKKLMEVINGACTEP